jgi:hypothetical protein
VENSVTNFVKGRDHKAKIARLMVSMEKKVSRPCAHFFQGVAERFSKTTLSRSSFQNADAASQAASRQGTGNFT